MKFKALVVGRDGAGYEKERWFESHTFRSGGQRNLLVADNRARQYDEAEPQFKRLLPESARGERVKEEQLS